MASHDILLRMHHRSEFGLLDLQQVDAVMRFQNDDEFNFKLYYLDNGKISMNELVEKILKKAKL